jgi:hypothetical protein
VAPPGADGTTAQFGYSAASAGDVNGDGYADFVIGANAATLAAVAGCGAAHLYLGGSIGPSSFSIDYAGPDGANGEFGFTVTGGGDINGDGYSDFLVGGLNPDTNNGAAHLYLGSPNPSPAMARTDLANPDGTASAFGSALTCGP